jgi:hypothetical protein
MSADQITLREVLLPQISQRHLNRDPIFLLEDIATVNRRVKRGQVAA